MIKRFVIYPLFALLLCMGIAAVIVAFIPAADLDLPRNKSFVDMHVHTAGVGVHGSGSFISKSLRDGYKFSWYLKALGVTLEELESEGDVLVLKRLSRKVAASQAVGAVVVLALDGIIDEHGKLDRDKTQVYVPNDFLAEAVKAFDNLRFGASINPYRSDALTRLERAKADGAVLVKWIPAIMYIDPADEAIKPFYAKLIELDLPLLTHVGQERSFGDARDELGDPHRLKLPLEMGVTVIAAHIATTGENEGEGNFERLLPMFETYDNLYTEISSLTQVNKLGYLYAALARRGLEDRMLYGTDWPLQFFPLVSPWYQIGHIPIAQLKAISRLDNLWDRDVALKRAMGVPQAVMARSATLLKITQTIPQDN